MFLFFTKSSAEESSEASTQPELSDELFKQVTSLLQLVRSSSTKSSEAYALFMDELSAVVSKGQLNNKVEVDFGYDHVFTSLINDCSMNMCILDSLSEICA